MPRDEDEVDEAAASGERPQRYRWLGIVLLIAFAAPLLFQFIASALDAF